MNGIHDLGGLQCFGKIDNKSEDVKFVEDWERRLFASTLCSFGALGPIDAFRHAIEKMDPVHYLSSSYYEHWLEAVETRIKELKFYTVRCWRSVNGKRYRNYCCYGGALFP